LEGSNFILDPKQQKRYCSDFVEFMKQFQKTMVLRCYIFVLLHVRRTHISERMRKLQELVPNMDKARPIAQAHWTLKLVNCIYNGVVVVGKLTLFFMLLTTNQHNKYVGL